MGRKICWAAIALGVSGCATVDPYLEVGLGYQLDRTSDWFVNTDRVWQCSNPQFHGEVGVERDGWRIGYHHQSWLRCGVPFNHRPELYQDDIRIMKKFGGKDE